MRRSKGTTDPAPPPGMTWLAFLPGLLCLAAAAAPGLAQPTPHKAEITACLDRARPALHRHLRQNRGGVLALLCLAALHDGLPPTDAGFRRALQRLDLSVLNGTYGAALRLMVLAEDPLAFGTLTPDELAGKVARDARRILGNRFGGGFTYAKRNSYWDLSNTQYAALGLRAAQSLGFEVPAEVWARMRRTVLAVQASTGGFGYTDNHRRKRAYASMTVAGIAILQVCNQHLPVATATDARSDAESDARSDARSDAKASVVSAEVDAATKRAIAAAWRWMAEHRTGIGSEQALSCLYFHYGLERAAILSDVEQVGGRDWYRAGAAMLIRMQDPKHGSWRSSWEIRPGALQGPGSPVDTAFAVLFLRRRFQKTLPARYPRLVTLDEQAPRAAIEAAARRAVQRGRAALPDVIKALRSSVPPRRMAAALALRQLAGDDFGYDPKVDPARSAAAIKAAERWWLGR